MGKQAQISIIMIMVIIILVIFGIVYYLTSSSRERQAEKEMQTQQLAETKIKPIQEYVKSCLDLVSKNAVETIGKQGGYLYQSQGGPVPDFSNADVKKRFLVYDGFKVGYAVYGPEGDVVIYKSDPPGYPWAVFPYIETASGSAEYYFGFFGFNEMRALEKPFTNSIQGQLEVYTKNNLDACLDWSAFEQENIGITAQEAEINVVIGETTTMFKMKYPIAIKDKTSGAEQHLEEFIVNYNIRLRKFLDFIEYITDRDVTDIKFDISRQAGQDMSVKVVEDASGTKDDIVIITDARSVILDKPFEFRFARHNRNPALHFLAEKEISNNDLFGICNNAELTIVQDILKISNAQECTSSPKSKTIGLKAYDPDEDNTVFKLVIGQERNSYKVGLSDFYQGKFTFRIQVTDNEKIDWQDITLPMKAIEAG